MTKTRYITLFQKEISPFETVRDSRFMRKSTKLKGVLICGQGIEVSLSINARTEVFIAGQNGENTTSSSPNNRVIKFDENVEQNIYASIENKNDKSIKASVYLIIE